MPVCLYDNPRTTHVTLSDKLQGRIAALPAIASIKIPGLPAPQASERVAALRRHLPCGVTLGVSGDVRATAGLQAGCEVWYSVCGGLFPRISLALVKAIRHGDAEQVAALNKQLAPLWRCFDRYGGSLRVIAAAAAIPDCATLTRFPPLAAVRGGGLSRRGGGATRAGLIVSGRRRRNGRSRVAFCRHFGYCRPDFYHASL